MPIYHLSWEFCVSFDFDYSFISGKRKYRWPLVACLFPLFRLRNSNVRFQTFYFIGRYSLLAALIGMCVVKFKSMPKHPKDRAVSSRLTSDRAYAFAFHRPQIFIYVSYRKLNCQSLYTFNQVSRAGLIHTLRVLILIVYGQHRHWHGQRQSLPQNVSESKCEQYNVLYVFCRPCPQNGCVGTEIVYCRRVGHNQPRTLVVTASRHLIDRGMGSWSGMCHYVDR